MRKPRLLLSNLGLNQRFGQQCGDTFSVPCSTRVEYVVATEAQRFSIRMSR
jgi:hypothetical protein